LANLTRTNWPNGWSPSDDPLNGNPQGLQRMDNLQQDEEGCIALVAGLAQVNKTPLSNFPGKLYSRNVNGTESVWASLGFDGGDIVRSALGDFSDSVVIGTGTDRGCFGSAFGKVLSLFGSTRVKDDGINPPQPLGLITPGTPTVVVNDQPQVNVMGSWTIVNGTINSSNPSDVIVAADPVSLRADPTIATTQNLLAIGGVTSTNPDNDIFSFNVTPDDSSAIQSISVIIQVDRTDNFEVNFTQNTLNQGSLQTTTLSAARSQFVRRGINQNASWATPISIRFVIQCNAAINVGIGTIQMTGGAQGALNGVYTWIQVNVNDDGSYQAISPPGLPTTPYAVINGSVTLTPASVEPQVTDIWFYRITYEGSQVGNQNSFLDQYYRVATINIAKATSGTVMDTLSDDDVIVIDITLNPFLQTLVATDTNAGITESIISVEGPYFERMLYMSFKYIYLSDNLNPDAIDSRYTIRLSGDNTEKNTLLKLLTNNVLYAATTKNSYELSGTLEALPDGTLDIQIIPIGEQYPPISLGDNCVNAGGAIYYVAADGVRATTGSNSQLISPQLRLLFQGLSRAGLAPILKSNVTDYPIAVAHTKLFVVIPFTDGVNRLVVFDTLKNIWRFFETDPKSIFVTQTDRVLLGYDDVDGGDVFEAEKGIGVTNSSGQIIEGLPIFFQTIYDDNGEPRNRKDTFTLKIVADTGGRGVDVYLDYTTATSQDYETFANQNFQHVGTINSTGKETFYFDIQAYTLGFKYALRLVDTLLLTAFHLYEYTIEYQARPEQNVFLRILPDNLGTDSRKRFITYAFVIDTLGNNVTFQPIIDNVPTGSGLVFSTPTKQTVIYYFEAETLGTDIGGTFIGGPFEFYSLQQDQIVSEKLPAPTEYLLIPANNYGTPNRKRFSSYKFQIITRGQQVKFTPRIDGVNLAPITFTTTDKRTIEYFFTVDTIGIDIGGILQSVGSPLTPFEWYGELVPQQIEQLPPQLEFYKLVNTNFGVAARKRIRTVPFVIDTLGQDVQFQPLVDGVFEDFVIFNTFGKTTVWWYAANDIFCTDFGGNFVSQTDTPFEFYETGQPEIVEVQPVGKMYDQLGPIRFDKIGKVFTIRVRIVTEIDISLPYSFYDDTDMSSPFYGTPAFSGTFVTVPGVDIVVEIPLPKNVNMTVCRLVIGPGLGVFHRYDAMLRVQSSGMETDAEWIPVK
jgi:hypothetical protein